MLDGVRTGMEKSSLPNTKKSSDLIKFKSKKIKGAISNKFSFLSDFIIMNPFTILVNSLKVLLSSA